MVPPCGKYIFPFLTPKYSSKKVQSNEVLGCFKGLHIDTEGYGFNIWNTKEGRIYFSTEEEKKNSGSVNTEKDVISTGIWM